MDAELKEYLDSYIAEANHGGYGREEMNFTASNDIAIADDLLTYLTTATTFTDAKDVAIYVAIVKQMSEYTISSAAQYVYERLEA